MKFLDWIDSRTSLRPLIRHLLFEAIPGGAKWRYVWGSALLFVFAVQVVTGILLMTAYSPSATTAWPSVWYIQTQMTLGWLIRGLHHFGSQAMVVLLPLHILQVVLAKAYRAPREFNWWIGLALLGVVLGLSLTGYLLPWDQKGYWATKVATNIMELTPIIGGSLQRIVVGGEDYGHATLTRFYTLHVMILPGAAIVLAIAHLALFRKHGVTFSPKDADKSVGNFWPDQAWRDTVAAGVIFVALFGMVFYTHYAVGSHLLDAPADPTASDYPARPEWYFLFLFQMLKLFEGPDMERIGAIGVPALIGFLLFCLPLIDKVLPARFAHFLSTTFVLFLMIGAATLTVLAIRDDSDPAKSTVEGILAERAGGARLDAAEEQVLRAWDFNRKRDRATATAKRALQLAAEQGIPPAGPLELMANDYMLRGAELFAANCAACHRFGGHDGLGTVPTEPATSSDLKGFGTSEWTRSLLTDPMNPRHFGLMKNPDGEPAHTRMKKWITEQLEENENENDRGELFANFDAVSAYLEVEASQGDSGAPLRNDATIARGQEYFMTVCNECHSYQGKRRGTTRAPDFFGYGSARWIADMIADPGHDMKYSTKGREPAMMTAFSDQLSEEERLMIAKWINAASKNQSDK